MQDFSSRNARLFQVEMQGYFKLNVKIFKPNGKIFQGECKIL